MPVNTYVHVWNYMPVNTYVHCVAPRLCKRNLECLKKSRKEYVKVAAFPEWIRSRNNLQYRKYNTSSYLSCLGMV